MDEVPAAVFVYGTLKQGERNFPVSQRAGWLRSERGWLGGFQLFHIPRRERLPYSYPAMARGEGRVWGEVQWFADLETALEALDVLEDEGREYLRIPAEAHLGGTLEHHGFDETPTVQVWTYVYPDQGAINRARGILLPDGVWLESEAPDEAVQGER
ncbi:MAG: gamma-glutamylcyclotransferase [Meiothermus sp.]